MLGLEKRGCNHGQVSCWVPAEQKYGCCKSDEKEECECGRCRVPFKNHPDEEFCCPICDCSCGIQPKAASLASYANARPEDYECSPCDHKGNYNCFPATASVTLRGGKRIMMSELRVGDRVQTGKDICLYF